ncbi:MAG: ABC transporter ATP-binding protein [Planctomycetales bacterium]|nr:ABC transporter ATP-binding protein [Planctomycetales bacterium]
MSDVLIKSEHVSKKFCRSLKRSLWYGVKDVTHSLNPWAHSQEMDSSGDLITKAELRADEFWALQDINFEVRRGECLGLIGHNGAGKSTLLKILNGLIRPDSGRITMRGKIGAMIELGAGFNPILTGRENIFNQAALLGFTTEEVRSKFDAIVDFAEIEQALDMPLQNYSSGMRVRLGFAVFAFLEPDVLLIDEVLAVGDVGFRFKSLNKMSELMNRCAVIFVTHTMPQVFRVCNELILLDHGKIAFQGTDIALGVSKYFDAFQQGTQAVTGSGEAKVLELTATSNDQRAFLHQTLSIQFGEDVEVTVKLQINAEFRGGKIQLLFWNTELLPVMDVMTDKLLSFPFDVDKNGQAIIRARLPKVNLNAGKYNLSVIVLSKDLKVLCRHDGAVAVNVTAHCASGANVILAAEWAVCTA